MKLLVLLSLIYPNSRLMWHTIVSFCHQTLLEAYLGEDLGVSQL